MTTEAPARDVTWGVGSGRCLAGCAFDRAALMGLGALRRVRRRPAGGAAARRRGLVGLLGNPVSGARGWD